MSEASAVNPRQPLNEVMLAMDVVDTLRHQQLLVQRELDSADREQKMKQRLREIYASQGIDVPEHIIEQGVAALEQGRFVYEPAKRGARTAFARLYISRGKWARPVLVVLAAILILSLAYAALISGPARRASDALPERLENQYQQLLEDARGEVAIASTDSLHREGLSALQKDDEDEVESVLERMDTLQEDVERAYDIRIVSRPGERSGVWRIPDANSSARNFYLLVEAVGAGGERFEVPIRNEEDGKFQRVKKWGLRVDEELFKSVADDKNDDGIIQYSKLGSKRRGFLKPEYLMPTTGAAITSW